MKWKEGLMLITIIMVLVVISFFGKSNQVNNSLGNPNTDFMSIRLYNINGDLIKNSNTFSIVNGIPDVAYIDYTISISASGDYTVRCTPQTITPNPPFDCATCAGTNKIVDRFTIIPQYQSGVTPSYPINTIEINQHVGGASSYRQCYNSITKDYFNVFSMGYPLQGCPSGYTATGFEGGASRQRKCYNPTTGDNLEVFGYCADAPSCPNGYIDKSGDIAIGACGSSTYLYATCESYFLPAIDKATKTINPNQRAAWTSNLIPTSLMESISPITLQASVYCEYYDNGNWYAVTGTNPKTGSFGPITVSATSSNFDINIQPGGIPSEYCGDGTCQSPLENSVNCIPDC
jgi:hypothetical protein